MFFWFGRIHAPGRLHAPRKTSNKPLPANIEKVQCRYDKEACLSSNQLNHVVQNAVIPVYEPSVPVVPTFHSLHDTIIILIQRKDQSRHRRQAREEYTIDKERKSWRQCILVISDSPRCRCGCFIRRTHFHCDNHGTLLPSW